MTIRSSSSGYSLLRSFFGDIYELFGASENRDVLDFELETTDGTILRTPMHSDPLNRGLMSRFVPELWVVIRGGKYNLF